MSEVMNDILVSVKNLHKSYLSGSGVLTVLKGVSLSLSVGEKVLISGVSGSGKSTLLHLLGLLDAPTEGTIHYRGRNISKFSEKEKNIFRMREIGFVFQSRQLMLDLTVLENIALPAMIAGTDQKSTFEKARSLLPRVGLLEREHYYPEKLSGGESQRVAIARSLMNDPSLILADEPTGSLDTKTNQEIKKLLLDISEKFNTTICIVSHDPGFIDYCDRHLHLEDGILE